MTALPKEIDKEIEKQFEKFAENCSDQDFEAHPAFEAGAKATWALAMEKVKPLVEALEKIDQLESLPLPDQNTVSKKFNVMASFARGALDDWRELTGGGG